MPFVPYIAVKEVVHLSAGVISIQLSLLVAKKKKNTYTVIRGECLEATFHPACLFLSLPPRTAVQFGAVAA